MTMISDDDDIDNTLSMDMRQTGQNSMVLISFVCNRRSRKSSFQAQARRQSQGFSLLCAVEPIVILMITTKIAMMEYDCDDDDPCYEGGNGDGGNGDGGDDDFVILVLVDGK